MMEANRRVASDRRRSSARSRRPGPGRPVERLEGRTLLSAGYNLRVVAALGDPLPNPADGVFTTVFETGGLNDRGQVMFVSDQGKPTAAADNGQAAFLTRADGGKPIRTLALPNTPAPGGGTFGGFGSLSPAAVNDKGDAAFAFTLVKPNAPIYHAGVYRFSHDTGRVTPVEVPGVTRLPDGSVLRGTSFSPSINDRGDVAFVGVVNTTKGSFPATGLGEGLFLGRRDGSVRPLVVPGDPAPGGSTFDSVQLTSINDEGAIAFGGHVAADPVLGNDGTGLGGFQSVFLRHTDGTIEPVARQGTPIPSSAGGGWYDVAFGPVVNAKRQVAFTAAISPTKPTGAAATDDPSKDADGVFLYSAGRTIAIARPGDVVPGGAHVVSTSFFPAQMHLNDRGEVTYNAALDDGTQGVFVWAKGVTRLVARTGTRLPGGRVIAGFELGTTGKPNAYATNNDRGQVAFGAVLRGGGEALVLATPGGQASVAPVAAAQPRAYAPGSLVRGKTVAQWAADWWTQVFETPVHKADGKAIRNPNFDPTGARTTAVGDAGRVFNLFGSFAPGQVRRTATVPAGEPVFVPVLPIEFSNADTAAPDGTYPGHYTATQLAAQARASADAIMTAGGELHATVDGRPVADLAAHREASGRFSYTLPASDNVLQNFGLAAKGRVSPAVADGFYLMLQPLAPGRHVISFGGTVPPASPLGAFSIDVTYVLEVKAPAAVAAPHATVAGKTLGAWSAAWWQWAAGIPAASNPTLDATGARAGTRQSGPVYFLAGSGKSDPVTRRVTVPAGKRLFFPIINEVWLSEPGDPGVPDLRAMIGKDINSATGLKAVIDGKAVPAVAAHRERDPFADGFSVKLPAGNIFGAPAGTYAPDVADGYWLMLAPLSAGRHTIHFAGKLGNGFSQDVTYDLTVAP